MPMEGRGVRTVQFGLKEKMQAAGFIVRIMLDTDFCRVSKRMVALGVLVGEAATYNRGGRLMPDLNCGRDFGYQFAPHQLEQSRAPCIHKRAPTRPTNTRAARRTIGPGLV